LVVTVFVTVRLVIEETALIVRDDPLTTIVWPFQTQAPPLITEHPITENGSPLEKVTVWGAVVVTYPVATFPKLSEMVSLSGVSGAS
jgi:hypothetical protein